MDDAQNIQPNGDEPFSPEVQEILDRKPPQAVEPPTQEFPHPFPCGFCPGSGPTQRCLDCQKYFDLECKSEIDARYCKECLTFKNAELKEQPLVDDEGVRHNGRELTPTENSTGFKTMAREIADMSDDELRQSLAVSKAKVKELETITQYQKVKGSSLEMEIEQRSRIKMRGLKMPPGMSSVKIGPDGKKKVMTDKERYAAIAAHMIANNISPADLVNRAKELLAEMEKKKQ